MSNSPWSGTVSTLALVSVLALAACAGGEKPADAKADVMAATETKAGPPGAVRAGQLATAMVSGEAEKGVSTIRPGEELQGSLGAGDGLRDDDSYFDAWVFALDQAGDVAIGVSSGDFDAYVSVYRGSPGAMGDFVGSDDDGGNGTDALALLSLAAGTYTALANSFAAGETGSYVIALSAGGAGGGDTGRVLAPGRTGSGALTAGDETLGDDSHYQDWSLGGQPGDRFTVTLRSSDFDAYLMVVQDGEVLASDDDSGGGTDSQVSFTLPAAGSYTVRVNTFGAGETGAFTLAVESGGGPEPFAGFATGGDPSGRYALLVGIDDYPGTGSDLRGPVEDARIMERILVERFGFAPADIVTLRDADATRQNIAQGIVQHLGQAGPDGVAVLFYSGHGTQIGENIGLTGSLDPEPRGEGDEAIYVYGHEFESSILLDEELGYLIETIDAGRALVVVDACFSGEITRASGDAPQSKVVDLDDPEVAGAVQLPTTFITSELKSLDLTDMSLGFGDFGQMAALFANPQRHVMWGGSTEDQVSWTSGLGNGASVFTYYLGEHMGSVPGSTTLSELNALVHADVVAYIEGNGNMTMQNPQMRGASQSMTLDDFFRQR